MRMNLILSQDLLGTEKECSTAKVAKVQLQI